MDISVIPSKKVCGNNYLLGFSWGKDQLRIGLVWIHIVILFN